MSRVVFKSTLSNDGYNWSGAWFEFTGSSGWEAERGDCRDRDVNCPGQATKSHKHYRSSYSARFILQSLKSIKSSFGFNCDLFCLW